MLCLVDKCKQNELFNTYLLTDMCIHVQLLHSYTYNLHIRML